MRYDVDEQEVQSATAAALAADHITTTLQRGVGVAKLFAELDQPGWPLTRRVKVRMSDALDLANAYVIAMGLLSEAGGLAIQAVELEAKRRAEADGIIAPTVVSR